MTDGPVGEAQPTEEEHDRRLGRVSFDPQVGFTIDDAKALRDGMNRLLQPVHAISFNAK